MKKYSFFILVVFSLFNCRTNENKEDCVKQSTQIIIGHIDSIYSNILGETRKIWIHVPESFKGEKNDRKYPVLYLLDGSSNFYSVTGIIKKLGSPNFNTPLPEMIVVAIPNTNRIQDLVPSHADINLSADDTLYFESGEGDEFLDFIERELIPYIDKNYPTVPIRTYVGHSLGGLSVINALINKPHLFNNYISIDPSIYWYNYGFTNYADSILNTNIFEGKALYMALANNMGERMEIHDILNDTSVKTAEFRSDLKFVQSLENNTTNDLNFQWKYYIDENHGSVPLIAIYDGLHFLFHWYNFEGLQKIYFSAPEMTTEELLELPKAYFKEVSNHFGYEILPPEKLINSIGIALGHLPEKAFIFFDLNVMNYPNSPNVYNSRGDYYLAIKDTMKALEDFKKALEIDKKDFYKEKIEKLEQSIKN